MGNVSKLLGGLPPGKFHLKENTEIVKSRSRNPRALSFATFSENSFFCKREKIGLTLLRRAAYPARQRWGWTRRAETAGRRWSAWSWAVTPPGFAKMPSTCNPKFSSHMCALSCCVCVCFRIQLVWAKMFLIESVVSFPYFLPFDMTWM